MGIAVGIDLGTTNSCVAVVQAGKARVVEDSSGRRVHPSVVSFHANGSILCGQEARERLVVDPSNTIFSFKRLIGRDFGSAEIARAVSEMPYTIAEGAGGVPVIRARSHEMSVPEVSALMLGFLRQATREATGVDINQAVITCPANFNDVQRSSTKVAGRISGFNVLRVLNEPTAAALAYGFGNRLNERIVIYDFGGGTFDITIVEVQNDVFEVLATAGDTYLGGDDFDKVIAEEMRSQFLRQNRCDLAEDPMSMQRVRLVAEKIKCQLSQLDEVQATLREIAYGPGGVALDFSFSMKRSRFEELIEPFVERSLRVCDEAFKLANLDPKSIDNVVLVGGTTRVPLVRERVARYFDARPHTEINPDEVVAIGAAIHAFSLTGEELPAEARPRAPVAPMLGQSGLAAQIRSAQMPGRKPVLPPPLEPRPEPLRPGSHPDLAAIPPLTPAPAGPQAEERLPKPEPPGSFGRIVPIPSPVLPPQPPPMARLIAPAEARPEAPPVAAPPPPPAASRDHVDGDDIVKAPGKRESFSVSMAGKTASALLLDVTPRSLGVATTGGYCDTIIERNASIPVEQSRLFTTSHDGQTEVSIEVYQGESRRTSDNTLLGRVLLSGLRPAPRGDIKIRVTFEINTDGILGVSARNEETGEAQATRIILSGGLDDAQVESLVKKYSAGKT